MDIRQFMCPAGEKPLDNLVTDGGFCAIFRTIGCIGDSLSSGEFEKFENDGSKHYYDCFEYSWGQYIARAAGCKVYNFSRGGMTAREYCESFAESRGFWNPDLACQAYIIALGVNDVINGGMEIGSVDDVNRLDWRLNAKTFAGYYAQIIQRYRAIQPNAKFFLMTTPDDVHTDERRFLRAQQMRALLYELAKLFGNTYVIDLFTYGPKYDDEFKRMFYLEGHLNPAGYLLTGKMVASYIDYIVRHNIEDFKYVGYMNMKPENFLV